MAKTDRETIQFQQLSEGIYAVSYKKNIVKSKYTKEQINKILEDGNEDKLREVSQYFFMTSGQYRRLVQNFSTMLTFGYLVVPRVRDKSTLKQNKLQKDLNLIYSYTDDSYIEETSRFINMITVIDGAFYGYERKLDDRISIQQLPPAYCRSKYKINGTYAVEFNLRFFDTYKDVDQKINIFKMFPREFLDYYLAYKGSQGGSEWVQLDPNFARCHKFADNAFPLLSTVFPELINLKEYKELDKTQTQMDLYKLLVQELPTDKQSGLPLLKLEEAKELHKNAKKMITQEGIDVITSPLKVSSINLQERGQTVRDNIERASNSIYDTAGSSRILFSSGKDGGSIGLDASIKTDESILFVLLDQFKHWYDNKFKSLISSKNYYFEILFPKITIFNWQEMYEKYSESATLGYSKLLPMIALGMKQTTILDLLSYEEDVLGITEKLKPLQTSHTLGSDGGRPTKKQSDLTPNGEKARNNNTNKTRGQ